MCNVHNVRSSIMKLGQNNDTIEVEVILGRRLIGTFMTIYMPTILLNIIGHSTNYFKPFFFEAVVTVNLTVMLVLTTMFVGVSQTLPKTASIKMVDYWLVFNLLIPFVEVLIHTYEVRGAVNIHTTWTLLGHLPTQPLCLSETPFIIYFFLLIH